MPGLSTKVTHVGSVAQESDATIEAVARGVPGAVQDLTSRLQVKVVLARATPRRSDSETANQVASEYSEKMAPREPSSARAAEQMPLQQPGGADDVLRRFDEDVRARRCRTASCLVQPRSRV